MIIAPLLVKLHDGEQLTPAEKELVRQTVAAHNLNVAEAVALNIWSTDSTPIQEQLKYGNTYNHVNRTLETLAHQLWHLTPDGEEVRYVVESLQNICYANKTLDELYKEGRQIAMPGTTTAILAAIRKIHIAVNVKNIIPHIYNAISKNQAPKEITVYRALRNHVDGCEIINKGFMSTSLNAESSFAKYDDYTTLIQIKIPEGTPCVNVTPFSVYDVVESEILFPPNIIHITDRKTMGQKTILTGTLQILDAMS